MTSWIATQSESSILSNSSIQMIPLSAKTMAPASKWRSPFSQSTETVAVRPTPDAPQPVVLKQRGANFMTCQSIWDFAVEGSPTISMLISPLKWALFSRFFSNPPSIWRMTAFLMFIWPWIEGAKDFASNSKTSSHFESYFMFWISALWSLIFMFTSLICLTPVAIIIVLKIAFYLLEWFATVL